MNNKPPRSKTRIGLEIPYRYTALDFAHSTRSEPLRSHPTNLSTTLSTTLLLLGASTLSKRSFVVVARWTSLVTRLMTLLPIVLLVPLGIGILLIYAWVRLIQLEKEPTRSLLSHAKLSVRSSKSNVAGTTVVIQRHVSGTLLYCVLPEHRKKVSLRKVT